MTDRTNAPSSNGPDRFTGRHMAAILVSFFGVVIAVNIYMAYCATATFGGTVVDNSYVASQEFNGWLRAARADRALGWTVRLARGTDGRLDLSVAGADGRAIDGARIDAVARHPLGRLPERTIPFRPLPEGGYASDRPLPAGRWIVHIGVTARGATARRIVDLL